MWWSPQFKGKLILACKSYGIPIGSENRKKPFCQMEFWIIYPVFQRNMDWKNVADKHFFIFWLFLQVFVSTSCDISIKSTKGFVTHSCLGYYRCLCVWIPQSVTRDVRWRPLFVMFLTNQNFQLLLLISPPKNLAFTKQNTAVFALHSLPYKNKY